MNVPRTICLGFFAVIATGTVLLFLPASIANPLSAVTNPEDYTLLLAWVIALFTSTSAVCVTGLSVVDVSQYYTGFGQFVIMLLAQIGGLGYMTATTFLIILLGRRFGLKDKIAIQQSLDMPGLAGTKQLIQSIISLTLILELTGTFLLMGAFIPDFGPAKGTWFALFHSVSAFNNAGFGLLSDNLVSYAQSPLVVFAISLMIITGGIGYPVLMEAFLVAQGAIRRRSRRLWVSLQFKVVTTTTLVLLLGGTLALLLIEYHNPKTLGAETSLGAKLMLAWFQSVTSRTAGFNSLNVGGMTTAGLFFTIGLMFIGASPGGTGGGIKTTTMRVLIDCTRAVLQGKDEVVCYDRRLPTELIFKAVAVVFGSMMSVILSTMMLSWAEPELPFIALLFEAVSAYATVGLSMGISGGLSIISKLILVLTMYAGRVGILLLISAFIGSSPPSVIRYPEDNLLVG
jgi:trk system potassium uptake protein